MLKLESRSFLCVCVCVCVRGGGGAEGLDPTFVLKLESHLQRGGGCRGVGPFHFPFLDGDVPRRMPNEEHHHLEKENEMVQPLCTPPNTHTKRSDRYSLFFGAHALYKISSSWRKPCLYFSTYSICSSF